MYHTNGCSLCEYECAMIEIRKFKIRHMEGVKFTGPEKDYVTEKIFQILSKDICLTILKDDKVVAFCGIVRKKEYGNVWLVPTEDMKMNNIGIIRMIKLQLDSVDKALGINRVVTSMCGDKSVIRFLTWLGFKPMDNGIMYERIV